MAYGLIEDIIKELIDTDEDLMVACEICGVHESHLTDDDLDYLYSSITRCEECGEWYYTDGGECCEVVFIEELC